MSSPYDITRHVDYPKLKIKLDECDVIKSKFHNYMPKEKVEDILNNMKTSLSEKNSILQTRINNLESSCNVNEFTTLKNKYPMLEEEKKSLNTTISTLNSTINKLQSELSIKNSQLSEMSAQSVQITKLISKIKELETYNRTLQSKLSVDSENKNVYTNQSERINKLETEKKTLNETISSLNNMINNLQAQVGQQSVFNTQISTKTNQINNLINKVKELETLNKTLQNNLTSQLSSGNTSNSSQIDRITKLENENGELKNSVNVLTIELKKYRICEQDNKTLRMNIKNLEGRIYDLQTALNSMDKVTINSSKSTTENLINEIRKGTNDELMYKNNEIAESKAEIMNLKSKINNLENEKHKLLNIISNTKSSPNNILESNAIIYEKVKSLELDNKKLLEKILLLSKTGPENVQNIKEQNMFYLTKIRELEGLIKNIENNNIKLKNELLKNKNSDTTLIQKINSLEKVNESLLQLKTSNSQCTSVCNCDKVLESKNKEISMLLYEIKKLKENCNGVESSNCYDVPQWAKTFY